MDWKNRRIGKGKKPLLNALSLLPGWLTVRLSSHVHAFKVSMTESKVSARHARSIDRSFYSSDIGLFREWHAERDGVIVTPEERIVYTKIDRVLYQSACARAELLFCLSGGARVE